MGEEALGQLGTHLKSNVFLCKWGTKASPTTTDMKL